MIRLYSAAIKAALEERSVLADVTFEGIVTDRPEAYCAFFLSSGRRHSSRFTSLPNDAAFSLITHAVGQTIDQAQLIDEAILSTLVGRVLIVEGRNTHRITHEVARKPDLDRDVTPPLWLIANEFAFISEPA